MVGGESGESGLLAMTSLIDSSAAPSTALRAKGLFVMTSGSFSVCKDKEFGL